MTPIDAMDTTKIRAYRPGDARGLATFHEEMAAAREVGGRAWVIEQGGRPVGYGAVVSVPGLAGLVELRGFIAPKYRRRGLGGRLLRHVLAEAGRMGARQMSYRVTSLDEEAAVFLQGQGFYMEHKEWGLERDMKETPFLGKTAFLPEGYQLQTLARPVAVSLFRQLYEAAFAGLPWYQPYTSDSEVAAELDEAGDLLFLWHKETAVGFAWTQRPEPSLGEIEPFGIIPAYQDKGLGRALLDAALAKLAGRGVERVRIGAWATNKAAIGLYEWAGFRHDRTYTYLACDL